MTTTIFVPRDSTALALGADEVAQAIAAEAARRGADAHIVRNGSRGMFWLEPLVEVQTDAGRVAYGPVSPSASACWPPVRKPASNSAATSSSVTGP